MNINYIGVLVAGLVFYFIGAVWYSVFNTQWISALETTMEIKSKEELKWGGKISPFIISFCCIMVMELIFAVLLYKMPSIQTPLQGAEIGFLIWVGFSFAQIINNYAFANRTVKLALFDSAYYFMGLITSGVILMLIK